MISIGRVIIRHRRKILIWTAACVTLFALIGFLVVPPILKSVLAKQLTAALHREVSIREVRVNPFALSATLRGVAVKEREDPENFASLEELYVNLEASSLFRWAVVVRELRLAKPFVRIVRRQDQSFNFSDLLEGQKAQQDTPKKPLRFSVNNIAIADGGLDFQDDLAQKTHTIRELNVGIPFLSNIPTHVETFVQPGLSAVINGTRYALQGHTKPFADSQETTLDVDIADLDLPYYVAYVPRELLNFALPSGRLDARLAVTFVRQGTTGQSLDVKGGIGLRELAVDDTRGHPVVRIPRLDVELVSVEPLVRKIHLSRVSLESPELTVRREKTGVTNLETLLPKRPSPDEPAKKESREEPAVLDVDEIRIAGAKVLFSDLSTSTPFKTSLNAITLSVLQLSNRPDTKGTVSLTLKTEGNADIALEGSVSLNPVLLDGTVEATPIPIRPFEPYFADRVKVTVADGRVSTRGRLNLSIKEPAGLQTSYAGDVLISKFAAIEKVGAEDLLKWQSLGFRDLSVSTNPVRVRAKQVSLTDFFARILIQPDGRLNLQDIVETPGTRKPGDQPEPAPETNGEERGAAADIRIEEVTFQGGRVQFSDRSLTPNYSADMIEIGGRLSALSSEEASRADVDLRGKLNNSAPLEITGTVNPLKQDLFVDLRARFVGMDLSPTSPYSGKYVGYSIEKGKLSFDVRYHIDQRKLDSEHKVFIDQLTFGEKVDSPTATSLPVKLAVALLKDRNGEIHLDLPVTGSIDDPQFSVWTVILDIVGNLVAKAATSPFALLGAAFGGGEELQYVEFDSGRATIPAEGAKKIETLVTALSEKPSLKLEIAGHVDMDGDREGLKQFLLQRKVKGQKLNDLMKQGSPAVPVDDVVVGKEEYEKYLSRAYAAETFPKPRNFIGLVKSLPNEEMEKLIVTHTEVGDEELRLLASQRANAVKDAILRSGKIDAERLFIIEPKTLAPEKKENQKDSRVEFKIG
jgi:uncharacterized protein involved in outer membrane biogenesis